MSRIKIRNSSLIEQGTIVDTVSCSRTEKINSDNVLAFTAPLTTALSALIVAGNVADLDDDYFDLAFYRKGQDSQGNLVANTEWEHVSYRLNDPDYDLEYFTQTGSPAAILGQILSGTGFTVGTVEPSAAVTYSAQEAKSRRAILMELVDLVSGEVEFNKFSVSIKNRRGSATPVSLTASRDVEIIEKSYNAREKDSSGNPLVTHTCSMIRPLTIALGDSVTLTYPSLDIDTELRVVSITTNPYNQYEASFEIGNFVPGLADDAYRIETSMVAKGAKYYGARISAENGFESIRNDNMARTVMNADVFAMQVGDGSGTNWTDKLYFDPATGKYIFDGELSATLINALEAEFDVTITNTVIVNNLTAQKGYIAELTVDQLDTSTKVQNYLTSTPDDVNYSLIKEEFHKFITARKKTSGTLHVENRSGQPLYWTDGTCTGITETVTDYPVTTYDYDEHVKMVFELYNNGTDYIPRIVLGTGSGVDDIGKGIIEKIDGGLMLKYIAYDGSERTIKLHEDGIIQVGNTGAFGIRNIAIGATPATPQNNDLRIVTV